MRVESFAIYVEAHLLQIISDLKMNALERGIVAGPTKVARVVRGAVLGVQATTDEAIVQREAKVAALGMTIPPLSMPHRLPILMQKTLKLS